MRVSSFPCLALDEHLLWRVKFDSHIFRELDVGVAVIPRASGGVADVKARFQIRLDPTVMQTYHATPHPVSALAIIMRIVHLSVFVHLRRAKRLKRHAQFLRQPLQTYSHRRRPRPFERALDRALITKYTNLIPVLPERAHDPSHVFVQRRKIIRARHVRLCPALRPLQRLVQIKRRDLHRRFDARIIVNQQGAVDGAPDGARRRALRVFVPRGGGARSLGCGRSDDERVHGAMWARGRARGDRARDRRREGASDARARARALEYDASEVRRRASRARGATERERRRNAIIEYTQTQRSNRTKSDTVVSRLAAFRSDENDVVRLAGHSETFHVADVPGQKVGKNRELSRGFRTRLSVPAVAHATPALGQ